MDEAKNIRSRLTRSQPAQAASRGRAVYITEAMRWLRAYVTAAVTQQQPITAPAGPRVSGSWPFWAIRAGPCAFPAGNLARDNTVQVKYGPLGRLAGRAGCRLSAVYCTPSILCCSWDIYSFYWQYLFLIASLYAYICRFSVSPLGIPRDRGPSPYKHPLAIGRLSVKLQN
jgi:hypothetical protein